MISWPSSQTLRAPGWRVIFHGFSVCKLAREMGNMPIIMVTAKGGEEDKLRGYDYGADDYVTKPFSPSAFSSSTIRMFAIASPGHHLFYFCFGVLHLPLIRLRRRRLCDQAL